MTRFRCVDDQKAAGFPGHSSMRGSWRVDVGVLWLVDPANGRPDRASGRRSRVGRVDAWDPRRVRRHYGVPRMHRELRRAQVIVNVKRVRRLMRLHGMAGRSRRRRCQTTFPVPTAL